MKGHDNNGILNEWAMNAPEMNKQILGNVSWFLPIMNDKVAYEHTAYYASKSFHGTALAVLVSIEKWILHPHWQCTWTKGTATYEIIMIITFKSKISWSAATTRFVVQQWRKQNELQRNCNIKGELLWSSSCGGDNGNETKESSELFLPQEWIVLVGLKRTFVVVNTTYLLLGRHTSSHLS